MAGPDTDKRTEWLKIIKQYPDTDRRREWVSIIQQCISLVQPLARRDRGSAVALYAGQVMQDAQEFLAHDQ